LELHKYQNTLVMDDEKVMKSTPTTMRIKGGDDQSPTAAEKKNETNPLDQGGEEKQEQQLRMVILAGPHKTASTETQWFLANLQWFFQKSLLAPFQLPSDPDGEIHTKQFSNLVKDLYEEQRQQKTKKNEFVFEDYKEGNFSYKEHYRNEFQRIWSHRQTSSNSIVLGAELWGPLSLHKYGPGAIRELMALLPSNKNKVTVALNYRTPRFDHLFSIYQQSKKMQEHLHGGDSFRNWMCKMDCTLPDPKLNLRVLNTLGQALAFRRLQQDDGDDVVVVDMSGAAAQGMDIREVYACEILHLDACKNPSSRNRMLATMEKPPKTKEYSLSGVKTPTESSTKINNSTAKLLLPPLSETLNDLEGQINEVLRKLDCSYFDAITSPNSGIRLLYSSYNASYCPSAFRKEASSFTDGHACLAIQKVLKCPGSNFPSSLPPPLPPPLPPVPTGMKRSDISNTTRMTIIEGHFSTILSIISVVTIYLFRRAMRGHFSHTKR